MRTEYIALLMICIGWLVIFFLDKRKENISKGQFKILCALSFSLNILGASICIVGLAGAN